MLLTTSLDNTNEIHTLLILLCLVNVSSNMLLFKCRLHTTEKMGSAPPNFNTSTYHLRINFNESFGVDAGVVGSLVDKSGRFWGIQDLIHMAIKNSLHPNYDVNRFFLGGSYNNFQHVKL